MGKHLAPLETLPAAAEAVLVAAAAAVAEQLAAAVSQTEEVHEREGRRLLVQRLRLASEARVGRQLAGVHARPLFTDRRFRAILQALSCCTRTIIYKSNFHILKFIYIIMVLFWELLSTNMLTQISLTRNFPVKRFNFSNDTIPFQASCIIRSIGFKVKFQR